MIVHHPEPTGETSVRVSRARPVFIGVMLLLAAVFITLGTWQVQRLSWKLDLIDRVEARLQAEPVPAPTPENWAGITSEADEYRRVFATGHFSYKAETLVQAVTDLGAGFWVLTPLETSEGMTVLVNRGFVPADRRSAADRAPGRPTGEITVTGLLRPSEPGGAFLRANDPQNDRWYSRDTAAIALAKGFGAVAPYFIDADASLNPGGLPVGGMTVVRFRNSHLVYAITWYSLAAMALVATVVIRRRRLI